MKLLLTTDFNTNEYWEGTSYCLLQLSTDGLERLLDLRQKALTILADLKQTVGQGYGFGALEWSLPGNLIFFDDYDENTITALLGEKDFTTVPEEWEPPQACAQAHTELHTASAHSDGDIWIRATCKHSSDFVEVNLPYLTLENGQIKISDRKGVPPRPALVA